MKKIYISGRRPKSCSKCSFCFNGIDGYICRALDFVGENQNIDRCKDSISPRCPLNILKKDDSQ